MKLPRSLCQVPTILSLFRPSILALDSAFLAEGLSLNLHASSAQSFLTALLF